MSNFANKIAIQRKERYIMAELLPCPLCGGEVYIDRYYIVCDKCHLMCRVDDRVYNGEATTYQEARQQTVDCWNTRTTKERGGEK